MTRRKFVAPALIDPPSPDAPVEEWTEYREGLLHSGIPGIAPFIRQADRAIKRATRPE